MFKKGYFLSKVFDGNHLPAHDGTQAQADE